MVAPWTELSGHEAPACLLEPLFGSELRGLGPVTDPPRSGVYSPDHLLRLMPELTRSRPPPLTGFGVEAAMSLHVVRRARRF
jgi:hypothetical protein